MYLRKEAKFEVDDEVFQNIQRFNRKIMLYKKITSKVTICCAEYFIMPNINININNNSEIKKYALINEYEKKCY